MPLRYREAEPPYLREHPSRMNYLFLAVRLKESARAEA
jgi:hypothetical protein